MLAEPGVADTKLVELGKLVNGANRTTAQAKLASCFRTQCQPLNSNATKELMGSFERARRAANPSQDFIQSYTDALPCAIDSRHSLEDRRREYRNLMSELGQNPVGPSCHTKTKFCNR